MTRCYQVAGGTAVFALDGVDLDIAAGSTVAVMGASGSGKSTLLHLIGAMDRPDSGVLEVDGTEIGSLPARKLFAYRRCVGFVFQRFLLLPTLTALDNVLVPVLPYSVSFDKRRRAVELLESVGLAGRIEHLPSRLSGGEQQRVAIARALINRPPLLLADEPTGNLDSVTGGEVLALLLGLRDEHGMTILTATHDPSVAERCDRVIRLKDGRVLSDTPS